MNLFLASILLLVTSGHTQKIDANAWVDLMPPGPHKLYVVIKSISHPGKDLKYELVAAVPQGVNHKELILELRKTKHQGWEPGRQNVQVRYSDVWREKSEYETVVVRFPDGKSIRLKINPVY